MKRMTIKVENAPRYKKRKENALNNFIKAFESYYGDLDILCKRLQDNYNGDKDFVQVEEDTTILASLLDLFDEIGE
jgi:hypothetical protein